MISAAEWSVIEEEAVKAGVDKFIPKPLFPSSIADCISSCLGVENIRPADQGSHETGSFECRKVLLVEDAAINREIVLALLKPFNLEIDCTENGVEAVKRFSDIRGGYDLVFMDVQMPEMDGYEATRRIRDLEESWRREKTGGYEKQVPIIAMTANVFREDIEKCLESGMNDHVGKPLDFEIVLEKLKQYL
jgi:CheY-like chemotaxis protein